MYNEKLEALITAALADGVLTDKEKNLLFKKAEAMGIDRDEFELVLEGRLAKRKKEMEAQAPQAAKPAKKEGAIPQELDDLIKEYLTDGIISAKERQVLLNKAQELGLNVDEVDLYIDAQQQKADQSVAAAVSKRRGKTCPYCGESIPELTDKCPYCGKNITPEASEELEEMLFDLQESFESYMSWPTEGRKAKLENNIRKAKMYYGNNPKVQCLVEETEESIKETIAKGKKTYRNVFIGLACLILFCFMGMIPAFISGNSEEAKAQQQERNVANEQIKELGDQVAELVSTGNLDSAKTTIASFSIPKVYKSGYSIASNFDDMYLALINAYINNGDLYNAEVVGSIFKLKINDDDYWKDTSCYKTLKKAFKKNDRDFSALKAK